MTVQAAVMALVEADVRSGLEVPVWRRYGHLVNQALQMQVRQPQSLYRWVIKLSFDEVTMSEEKYVRNQLCNTHYNTRRVFVRYSCTELFVGRFLSYYLLLVV